MAFLSISKQETLSESWLGNLSRENTVELYYDDIELEVADEDSDWTEHIEYEYKISPLDAAEVIQDLIEPDDPEIPGSKFESEEEYLTAFEKYIEDNIDDLIEKYYDELLAYNKKYAEEEVYEKYLNGDYNYLFDEYEPEYYPESLESSLDADGELNFEAFTKEINEYFDDAYEDTLIFEAVKGTVGKDGKMLLDGIITGEQGEKSIQFRFEPETALTEDLTKDTFVEKLNGVTFKVSNNLSEELFKFRFN